MPDEVVSHIRRAAVDRQRWKRDREVRSYFIHGRVDGTTDIASLRRVECAAVLDRYHLRLRRLKQTDCVTRAPISFGGIDGPRGGSNHNGISVFRPAVKLLGRWLVDKKDGTHSSFGEHASQVRGSGIVIGNDRESEGHRAT